MIQFIKSATKIDDYPDSNFEIVFVGRSNVGKSSLINALYGKVAYVGKTPGKTKMLNFFNVDDRFTVCDVPGYGFANRSHDEIAEFGQMMEDYFNSRIALKLCVVILDIRHLPTNDDNVMIKYLKDNSKNYLIVANKADKLSYSQCIESINKIACELGINKDSIFPVSTESKKNIDFLNKKIESLSIHKM